VANQFTTQLTDEIRDAVFGNVGSISSFRVGADADADALSKKFSPVFDRDDVLRIPNYNTVSQILVGGIPTQPFSMATLPPLGNPNPKLGQALRQLSAAKYGRPKAIVEAEIFGRLATKEDPKPAFGSGNPFGPPAQSKLAGAAPPRRPAGPASTPGGSSFLDEWLAKRKVAPQTAGVPAGPQTALAPAATVPQNPSLPPTKTPTPASQSQMPSPAGNISSDAIEQQEVTTIANELKQQLRPQGGTAAKPANQQANNDDTIAIDQDGTLHLRNRPR
jgi:hypothetical protein